MTVKSKSGRLKRLNLTNKQARKGFRPPSAMKGIGYFQNLRFFGRNYLVEINKELMILSRFLGNARRRRRRKDKNLDP